MISCIEVVRLSLGTYLRLNINYPEYRLSSILVHRIMTKIADINLGLNLYIVPILVI